MRDEELDRIIDAGLSTYAEPRVGLEQRVLAAVTAERDQRVSVERSSSWWMWAVGLAAAACLLIAITLGPRMVKAPPARNQQAVNDTHPQAVNREPAPKTPSEAEARVAAKHKVRRIQEARLQRLPKKQLFPTPQPLSPEMQALAQFAARAPEAQRKQLVDAQAKLDAPITIAPLQIAPLKESDEDEH